MNRDSSSSCRRRCCAPAAAAQARYVMGIDGGATKTLAAVLDLDAASCTSPRAARATRTPSAPQAAVDALLERRRSRAGARRHRASASWRRVVLAVAGTDTAVDRPQRPRRRAATTGSSSTTSSAPGPRRPAVGPASARSRAPAPTCSASAPAGAAWRVGGWGHLLGDEGSGYWLGTESIRAALRRSRRLGTADGARPTRPCDFFDVDSVEALAALVYSKPLTKGEIAAFAVARRELAEAGDAVARELYARGAARARRADRRGDRRTPASAAARTRFPVGLIGSCYKAGRRSSSIRSPRPSTGRRRARASSRRRDGARRRQPAARRARLRARRSRSTRRRSSTPRCSSARACAAAAERRPRRRRACDRRAVADRADGPSPRDPHGRRRVCEAPPPARASSPRPARRRTPPRTRRRRRGRRAARATRGTGTSRAARRRRTAAASAPSASVTATSGRRRSDRARRSSPRQQRAHSSRARPS